MMVLPVTVATASMTWPISTSRKLGVMRWPLLWALTTLVMVNARTTASRLARNRVLVVICVGSRAPRRALRVLLFIVGTSVVPGVELGGRLIHGDIAIPVAT